MRKHIAALAVGVLVLLFAAPIAAAGSAFPHTGRVLFAAGGDIAVGAGEHADLVVVTDGTATIAGDVNTVVVLEGTLAFRTGARAESLLIVRGHAELDAGSIVARDVLTLDATVTRIDGATVGGVVRGVETDVLSLGVLLGSAAVLLWVGFFVATVLAALALMALAGRQVQTATAAIRGEPVKVFVVGLIGLVVLPLVAVLAMATVIGIPTGIALLLGVWPFLAFLGYLVTAVWIGEWLVTRAGDAGVRRRPFLGAVVGVVVLQVLAFVPLVAPILTLFGFGSLLVAGWRVLRGPQARSDGFVAPAPAPVVA